MISNSTAIICLSKIGRLELLRQVYRTVSIAERVKEEVCIPGKPGYAAIDNAIRAGWLRMERVKQAKNWGLGHGENGTISLALEKKEAVLLDDAAARNLALSLGIETERTTTAIFRAYAKGMLNKKETAQALTDLVSAGYYIAPSHYVGLMERLR